MLLDCSGATTPHPVHDKINSGRTEPLAGLVRPQESQHGIVPTGIFPMLAVLAPVFLPKLSEFSLTVRSIDFSNSHS
jgi:hypothetical protein